MFVVLVDFEIIAGFEDCFSEAIKDQANTSLKKEPGCHYFDVCQDPLSSQKFFLYELYCDASAFDTHLKSEHFLSFDKRVTNWVSHKSVRLLNRLKTD
ncbi:putative quinol monooxygenase [Kiloniella antarctica]|uniref:Quinol monooxygenase n=1 Tax=Kiloniella antarctica TaxID=1550907 RepID=A0ABW5BLX8_9PROT